MQVKWSAQSAKSASVFYTQNLRLKNGLYTFKLNARTSNGIQWLNDVVIKTLCRRQIKREDQHEDHYICNSVDRSVQYLSRGISMQHRVFLNKRLLHHFENLYSPHNTANYLRIPYTCCTAKMCTVCNFVQN